MKKLFNKGHLKNASTDGHERPDASSRSITPFVTVPFLSAPPSLFPLHVPQHLQALQPKVPPSSAVQANDQHDGAVYQQQGLSAAQVQQLRARRERKEHRERMMRDSLAYPSEEDIWEVVRSPSPAPTTEFAQQPQQGQQPQSQMPAGYPQQGQQGQQRRQVAERKTSMSNLAAFSSGAPHVQQVVPSSRSSSLKALPPGALPPVASPHVQPGAYSTPSTVPTSSPVLAQHPVQQLNPQGPVRKKGTPSVHTTKDRDKEKDREKERDHSRSTAAILRALDPSTMNHNTHSGSLQQQQQTRSSSSNNSIRTIPRSPKGSSKQSRVQRTQDNQRSRNVQNHASRTSLSEIEFNAIDSDSDSFNIDDHDIDSADAAKARRREFDWWQRDREINVNAVGRDYGNSKDKDKARLRKESQKEKEKDRERESRGFFDRLQAPLHPPVDEDSRKRREGSQELERESKDGKEERDKKYQWSNILSAVLDRAHDKEKEKEKERGKERARAKEAAEARDVPSDSLVRMVGLFVTLSHEGIDWLLAFDISERTTLSEVDAKVIARALRKELKYARPVEQLGAATLWAIMLLNTSDYFITQTSSRKFLEVVEDLIMTTRSEALRTRLIEVLGAAVYLSADKGGRDGLKREGFRTLWRKIKPDGLPEEGLPLSTDHPMFGAKLGAQPPGTPRSFNSTDGRLVPANPPARQEPEVSQNGIIPVDEDMRRLFQECKVGQVNAEMLSEALAFATPDDLRRKDIIEEFYAKCRNSQDFLQSQIAWADVNAERSRQCHAELIDPRTGEVPRALLPTREEELLAELLKANEELTEALKIYEEVVKVGVEQELEKQLMERSRVDVRGNGMEYQQSAGDASSLFLHAPSTATSSSRSPSPSSMQQLGLQLAQASPYGPRDYRSVHKEPNELMLRAPSPAFSQQSLGQGFTPPPSNVSHGHVTTGSGIGHGNGNHPAPTRCAPHGPRSPQPVRAVDALPLQPQSRSPSPTRLSRPGSRTHSRAASRPTSHDLHGNNTFQTQAQTLVPPSGATPAQIPMLGSSHPYVSPHAAISEPTILRDSMLFHGGGGGMDAYDPEVENTYMSEKAAGKRRMVERDVENADVVREDANSDEFIPPELLVTGGYDADDSFADKTTWPERWKNEVRYVYDAAAERTRARIREGQLRNALAI